MAKRRKIQDYDWRYNLLRLFVDYVIKLSYRKIKYVGKDRVPTDGAVIYAPNHTGTLMDALVILAMDRKPKVFVARADIFKNPKLAKIFRFFKMMPIMRMRDGFDEVKKNNKTIEAATEVLKDKVPFCIFPEGTHQTKYSLQPISKGIFRIALQAQELMGEMPLYIVPVGIRYGSFWRFRASARVQIGEPMNVAEYLADNSEKTNAELMNIMRADLDKRMKDTLFYIPNDENYEATYEICAAALTQQVENVKKESGNPSLKGGRAWFLANKATVKQIDDIKNEKPEVAEKLFALGNKASKMRKAKHVSLKSVAIKRSFISRLWRILLLIVAVPYSLPLSLFVAPLNLINHTIFKKFKDQAFRNSVRFLMNLLLWPLLLIIYAVIAYCLLPWQWASLVVVLLMPAPMVLHDVYKSLRMLVSNCRLSSNKELKTIYQEIITLLFN